MQSTPNEESQHLLPSEESQHSLSGEESQHSLPGEESQHLLPGEDVRNHSIRYLVRMRGVTAPLSIILCLDQGAQRSITTQASFKNINQLNVELIYGKNFTRVLKGLSHELDWTFDDING
jgi:hypothetical protein